MPDGLLWWACPTHVGVDVAGGVSESLPSSFSMQVLARCWNSASMWKKPRTRLCLGKEGVIPAQEAEEGRVACEREYMLLWCRV